MAKTSKNPPTKSKFKDPKVCWIWRLTREWFAPQNGGCLNHSILIECVHGKVSPHFWCDLFDGFLLMVESHVGNELIKCIYTNFVLNSDLEYLENKWKRMLVQVNKQSKLQLVKHHSSKKNRITIKYSSSHNHGSMENGCVSNICFLSFRVILHWTMITWARVQQFLNLNVSWILGRFPS